MVLTALKHCIKKIQKHLFSDTVSPVTEVNIKTLVLRAFIRLSSVSGMLFLERQVAVEFLLIGTLTMSCSIISHFKNNKSIEVKHKHCVLLY